MLTFNMLLYFLSALQILFISFPFGGYIHPDEHFQCAEIAANDIFEFKAIRTWEWNNSHPCRTIIFPYIACGLPFILIKFVREIFDIRFLSSLLVVAPRCMMFLVIKIIEYLSVLIYKQNINYDDKALDKHVILFKVLFRSSYVTLILMSRPFSNTVECLLFVFVIYLMFKIQNKFMESDDLHHINIMFSSLGIFTGLGVFIRISFAAYALATIAIILLPTIFERNYFILKNIFRGLIASTFTFVTTSLVVIVIDNYYFRTDQLHITPLNLMKYNAEIKNLQQHGIHPRYLHFVVNMFLLFGPAYLFFIYIIISLIYKLANGIDHNNNINSLKVAMLVIVPVFIISSVPHQEPRYILPVFIPLLFTILQKIANNEKNFKLFLMFWFLFNFLCCLWFGVLHQGGILSMINKFSSQYMNRTSNTEQHFIFWKTYMIPKHLFMLRNESVYIHDLGGRDISELNMLINDIGEEKSTSQIFIGAPSSLHTLLQNKSVKILKLIDYSFPHVTMEDFPIEQINNLVKTSKIFEWPNILHEAFKLNLYKL